VRTFARVACQLMTRIAIATISDWQVGIRKPAVAQKRSAATRYYELMAGGEYPALNSKIFTLWFPMEP
jgi:hypothetical protein